METQTVATRRIPSAFNQTITFDTETDLGLKNEPWQAVIAEGNQNEISFNVMPGKTVKETLTIKEYRLRGNYIEAEFDREYFSSMEKSPSHLIFVSTLVHTQKLAYALLCHMLNLPYDPQGREVMKIWPYEFNIHLPKLIRKEKAIIQGLRLTEIIWKNEKEFRFRVETNIGSSATFEIWSVGYLQPVGVAQ